MATCSNDVDLLLIGKTGNGKSSTGNSILNRKLFKSDASTKSVTKQIQVHYSDYNGRIIKVVDGPGVGDTELNGVKAYTEMVKTLFLAIAASPRGYHAILLVVKFGGRFTKEDVQVIEALKTVFGKDFVERFCVLVVTYGDNFRCDATMCGSFEDWCSSQTGVFRNLIVECGHRVVLFDNRTKDTDIKNKQLDRLLEIVDGLKTRGQRYAGTYLKKALRRPDFRQPITHEQMDELEKMNLKEKIRKLKEEEKEHRETIERMAARKRKDLNAVEKEYVVTREDYKWKNFAGTGWSVLNGLNAIFTSWATYFLKSKKQS